MKSGIWPQIEYYLDKGVSLIPIYDTNSKNGKNVRAKVACEDWGEYQSVIVDKEFLFNRMECFDTEAVAAVCGRISGNLEVIDIDSKYEPGIAAEIFKDIKDMFPKLFKRLRIHQTKNAGNHIWYRILGTQVTKSQKLAGRYVTDEEKQNWILQNPDKNKNRMPKVQYFIETKAEGGYVVAPPSLGYSVIQDVEIPVITFDERECLINICKSYNKVVKEPKPIKQSEAEDKYYDESPFLHFSRTADAIKVLEELDWKYLKSRGKHMWFTRPGKEDGVSASFNTETRCFYVFTSNALLEESTGYFLSNIVALYKFNDDRKQMYAWLVQNGFGRIRASVEKQLINRNAFTNKELPPNVSFDARSEFKEFKEQLKELHPFGMFWNANDNNTISINRERLYDVAAHLGFRNYDNAIVFIQKNLIYKKTEREFYDIVKEYINVEDYDMKERVYNTYETFIKENGKFTMTRLKLLIDDEILFDTRSCSYKFYGDCWIEIYKDEVVKNKYEDLHKYVFADKKQSRHYKPECIGRYLEFLRLAVDLDIKPNYIKRIIGFLTHEYKDSAMGYIVLAIEKVLDPKKGGGTGKNIFFNLLNYSTTFLSKPGEQANLNEKFLQSWNGQKVFGLSDLPKDFSFSFLKEFVTGTSILKKLFKDELVLPVHKLPKIVCSTQWSYKITDGGLRRRIIPIEFTDFFTKMNGVDTYFGTYFPDGQNEKGWNDDDWSGYDWLITESIQEWMKGDLKLFADSLSDTGWNKQFRFSYNDTIVNIIEAYWIKWLEQGIITLEDFVKDIELYYTENDIGKNYHVPMIKLNQALAEYATYNNVYFDKDFVRRENGVSKRFKVFKSIAPKSGKDDDIPF